MTENGNGFSGFAKGLFVGGLLGTTVALLFAPRSRRGFRSDIPQEGVRSQRRYRPLPTTRHEKIIETGKPVKPSIGWLVTFILASAVAMIADLRIKKT
jgi:gas vesicle protein